MRMTGLRGIRQVGHPVVGHLNLLPARIVELLCVRPLVVDRVRLCQIVKVLRATAEVLLWISSMPQFELPTLVQTDGLPYALCLGDTHQQATSSCQNHCFKFLHHHDSFSF